MFGIAGAIDRAGDDGEAWVRTINRSQAHRGPDDAVSVRHGAFALGNTRLAILDPTDAGNQPFDDPEGRYVAVLNGELYNYVELIEQFRLDVPSGCDGAVIPLLWARFGTGTLDLLRGMYAMAVLDTVEQRLVLARDPFGIKPLYWRSMPNGRMAFASEPRALAQLGARPAVRRQAVADFLHLGALGADESPFDDVFAVPANGSVVFGVDGSHTVSTHGDRHLGRASAAPAAGGVARMSSAFRESVRIHLRSDVPTALLLSAGVDSTAIASVASRLGHQLHCLTVDGPGMSGESEQAAATARQYGHLHERVPVAVDDGDVSQFFDAMQRPTIDGLNTFVVCKAVKATGYKVALSGVGGDEALGGYRHARLLPWLRALRAADHLPAPVGKALTRVGVAAAGSRSSKLGQLVGAGGPRDAAGLSRLQRQLFAPVEVERLCGTSPRVGAPVSATGADGDASPLSRRALARAEVETYMMSMLLPDADAFSMTWSVEMRVPFVDREFFESALAVADTERGFGKATLVRALDDDHLLAAMRRPKTGFGLPMGPWIEGGLLSEQRVRTAHADAPVWGHVDRGAGLPILAGRHRWSEPWSLIALNEWLASL
ncbi:MAG: asparagine synthetase B family protein [Acidimicrobiales bacterium]